MNDQRLNSIEYEDLSSLSQLLRLVEVGACNYPVV